MAFFKTLVIASVAAVALAQGGSDSNTKVDVKNQSAEKACGNGQKLACCDSGKDLVGANCLSVPVLAVPVQKACGSNVAACCDTGSADGNLINLEANCASIPL